MSELVRDAVRHYQDLLVGKHLVSTREAVEKVGARVLRPHFMARSEYEQLLEASALLNRGVVAAADRLARDQALRRKLGIPAYMDPLIEIDRDHGVPAVMARFDGIQDRNGDFQAIEYNTLPGFNESLADVFASLPITKEFANRYAFRMANLTQLAGDAIGSGPTPKDEERLPVVAVPVTSLPASPDMYPRTWWVRQTEGRRFRIVEATVDEFRHDGGRLIIERNGGIVVDVLMPNWEDLTNWAGSPLALLDAVRAGSVRVLGGVSRGLLCGYKHTFELLSNPEHASLFEPEVAAALAKHVPWTRVVSHRKTSYRGTIVDLVPFVAENRQRLILKPSGGALGSGVLIGHACTDAVWHQTLKRALNQKYVVQERVLGAVESYPFTASTGDGVVEEESIPTFEPFVWRGVKPAGAMVRLSATGNHSFGKGGSMSALWIIDG